MRRLLAAGILLAASGLAACGGASDKPKATASVEADRAAAQNINLKPADFPSGWTSAPHPQTTDETSANRQFAECVGIPDPASRYTADERSPNFAQGQAASASSQVRMTKTEADTGADLAALQTAKGPECFKQTIEKLLPGRLPPGTTVANVSARQLEFPLLKDGTAAYRVDFTIAAAGGINVPVYVDSIVFQSGRAEVVLNTTSTGSPFDSKLEEDLARKMADRS